MVEPLTPEQIWGVPEDQLPDPEDKDFEACPVAEGYCAFFERGQCLAMHCVIKEFDG